MNTKLRNIQNWPELAQQANWSVANLAKRCGVSARALERYFHQAHGESPKTWLAKQRHQRAVELLRDGSSVKETATEIGYRHPSTFAREFKKLTGRCPHVLTPAPVNKPQKQQTVA